jgi:anti-sigma regulatory factor (Ser/Thr protein kinase)
MGSFIPVIDLDLQRQPQCARETRAAIGEFVPAGPIRDSLEVIASELVTNAFVHGYGYIRCLVTHNGEDYRIEVSNEAVDAQRGTLGDQAVFHSGGVLPRKHDSEGGRGLALVQSLSRDMGFTTAGNRVTVWALVKNDSL